MTEEPTTLDGATAESPQYAAAGAHTGCEPGIWVVWSPDPTWRGVRLTQPDSAGQVVGRASDASLSIRDRWISKQHARIGSRGSGPRVTWWIEDLGATHPTRVNGQGIAGVRALVDGDVVRLGSTVAVVGRASLPGPDPMGMIGRSEAIAEVRAAVRRYASATLPAPIVAGTAGPAEPPLSPVLIRGESGVGKELVAKALHDVASRKGRLVAHSLVETPPELFAATLYGHVRGAFTGADSTRDGLLDRARHGTLFLDEIGELPLDSQAGLLRAIDKGQFTPVGSTAPRTSTARIITATLQDLEARADAGEFRKDLYFRLSRAVIDVPPLADRSLDIALLAQHFLDQLLESRGLARLHDLVDSHPKGSYWMADLLEAALQATWPGNVRQLESWAMHVMHHAFADWPASDGRLPPPTPLASEALMGPRRTRGARPSDDGTDSQDVLALFEDPDQLVEAIVDRAQGQIRTFAVWAAPHLNRSVESTRRAIYKILGPEQREKLRRK